jgi:hypothetical protein
MNDDVNDTGTTRDPGRRTLLQRGLAIFGTVAAAATGGALATRDVRASSLRQGPSMTVFGRLRPAAPGLDARVTTGDLLDAPEGRVVGTFQHHAFGQPAPFRPQPSAGSPLGVHVLQFNDGTLFAMRGGAAESGEAVPSAVIGGTARYAGATGSLVERPCGAATRGHDLVEFVVTFAS